MLSKDNFLKDMFDKVLQVMDEDLSSMAKLAFKAKSIKEIEATNWNDGLVFVSPLSGSGNFEEGIFTFSGMLALKASPANYKVLIDKTFGLKPEDPGYSELGCEVINMAMGKIRGFYSADVLKINRSIPISLESTDLVIHTFEKGRKFYSDIQLGESNFSIILTLEIGK